MINFFFYIYIKKYAQRNLKFNFIIIERKKKVKWFILLNFMI